MDVDMEDHQIEDKSFVSEVLEEEEEQVFYSNPPAHSDDQPGPIAQADVPEPEISIPIPVIEYPFVDLTMPPPPVITSVSTKMQSQQPIPTTPEPTVQTQTPPITPDQVPASLTPAPRKRSLEPDDISPTSGDVLSAEDRPAKRQRAENEDGWTGVAKTMGRYAFVGAVSSAATIAYLVWSGL